MSNNRQFSPVQEWERDQNVIGPVSADRRGTVRPRFARVWKGCIYTSISGKCSRDGCTGCADVMFMHADQPGGDAWMNQHHFLCVDHVKEQILFCLESSTRFMGYPTEACAVDQVEAFAAAF